MRERDSCSGRLVLVGNQFYSNKHQQQQQAVTQPLKHNLLPAISPLLLVPPFISSPVIDDALKGVKNIYSRMHDSRAHNGTRCSRSREITDRSDERPVRAESAAGRTFNRLPPVSDASARARKLLNYLQVDRLAFLRPIWTTSG